MTFVPLPPAVRVLLLKFNLDEYTSWWNSPQAALYFWGGFILLSLVVAGAVTLWVMRTRSAK
jgi:hypothetical protein